MKNVYIHYIFNIMNIDVSNVDINNVDTNNNSHNEYV